MDHASFLADFVRANGFGRGAEIGVKEGRTLFHLLETVPRLRMIAVDPWARHPDHPDEFFRNLDWPHEEHYRAVAEGAGRFGDRVRIIRRNSIDAAFFVADRALDFVFIDADHSEPYVRADIAVWRPKVRGGGWLLGHDINWASVERAVAAMCPGWQDMGARCWGWQVP